MTFGRSRIPVFLVISLSAIFGNPTDSSADPIKELQGWLEVPATERSSLHDEAWATSELSRQQTKEARQLLWEDYANRDKAKRREELEAEQITLGEHTLKFLRKDFGESKSGRPLLISMHGGGGAPKAVNDQQWRNQIRLYKLDNGIIVAPRAPSNTWNLWHQAHIDGLFDRLIQNFVMLEGVDPNKIYLTGYSAGGDGVYQLAPRMADRFAAAAMMAGHPNETIPDGLRNLPFALYMGGKDAAYKRNEIAKQWEVKLKQLQADDKNGYRHSVVIFPEFGHWMNGKDAAGIEWMLQFERESKPERVVWVQDDVKQDRLYWLACDLSEVAAKDQLIVSREGNKFTVEKSDLGRFELLIDDEMIDSEKPIQVNVNGKSQEFPPPKPTILNLHRTLETRGIPDAMMPYRIGVSLEA
jgi:predicted esterase